MSGFVDRDGERPRMGTAKHPLTVDNRRWMIDCNGTVLIELSPMIISRPHFLLFCDGSLSSDPSDPRQVHHRGRWRFVLEDVEGGERLEASDAEQSSAPDRIALWAVVRGLEALSQPSRVTLVTTSRYVYRGLQYGLPEWRESDYCWEHFGAVQSIRNADLWRRIDHTLEFHVLHCRLMAGEESTDSHPETTFEKIEPFSDAIFPPEKAESDALLINRKEPMFTALKQNADLKANYVPLDVSTAFGGILDQVGFMGLVRIWFRRWLARIQRPRLTMASV